MEIALDRAKDVLMGLEIEKVELRDRFTAAKLELRKRIAEAEVSAI